MSDQPIVGTYRDPENRIHDVEIICKGLLPRSLMVHSRTTNKVLCIFENNADEKGFRLNIKQKETT